MDELYFYLVKRNLKTISQVPTKHRSKVKAKLDAEKKSDK